MILENIQKNSGDNSNIEKHPERITRIEPFIDQCKGKERGQSTRKSLKQTTKQSLSMFCFLPSNSDGIKKI